MDGAVTTTTPYLHSLPSVVLESSDLEEQLPDRGGPFERSVGRLPGRRIGLYVEICTGMHCERCDL